MKRRPLLLASLLLLSAWVPHGTPFVASPPTLSAQSAQPMGWSDVRGFVTTNTASGTLYSVVQLATTANPSATQIKACQTGASGTPAACTSTGISSSGAKGPIKLGSFGQGTPLTSVTNYKVFFVHSTTGGDSNVVFSAFTTKGKLTINATDGTGGACGHRWIDNPDVLKWNAIRSNLLQFFQNAYSTQLDTTIYIEFGWQCLNTTAIHAGAAAQSQYYVNSFSYNTATTGVRAKILALTDLNSFQASAFANFPPNDPTTLGNSYWFQNVPACALQLSGFTGASCTANGQAGWTAYQAGCWDLTVDGASRDGSGCYVLWGTMHHEVSEVIGRTSGWNNAVGQTIDVLRYGSSGVVKTSVGSPPAYPSVNNGATSFYGGTSGYNDAGNCNIGGGDCADLDNSASSAFNNNANAGLTPNPPLPGDFQLETIQGYYLTEKAMTCAEGTCTPF